MRSELLRAIVTSVLSDADALPELLEAVARVAADYLTGLDEAPVVPTVPTPLPRPLPPTGVGAQAMLAEFAADWLPSLAASAGPRFQAFVTGGTTPAALVGDWLTSVVDQNLVAAVGGADALERQALTWIGELLGVEALHGAFVSGATTANLTCLATARATGSTVPSIRMENAPADSKPRAIVVHFLAASSSRPCERNPPI